jgi:hypothetical protein
LRCTSWQQKGLGWALALEKHWAWGWHLVTPKDSGLPKESAWQFAMAKALARQQPVRQRAQLPLPPKADWPQNPLKK